LLQAQTGLVNGTNSATGQLSASQAELAIALLKDRAKLEALS